MSIFDRDPEHYSIDEAKARGQHAARLLEDHILKEAFEGAEWALIEGWARQDSTLEQREKCWAGIHALEAVRTQLRVIVGEGQFAAKDQHD